MTSPTLTPIPTTPEPNRLQRVRMGGVSSGVWFAGGGLLSAGLIGAAVWVLTSFFAIGVGAATFAIAALFAVTLGAFLGARFERLKRSSLEDPMTRVGNRRCWDEYLDAEVARALKSRMPLSLLVLDVDNLKSINDDYGHGCGDRVLGTLGSVLLATCRSRDIPARIGGDEFAVLLPRTRASEARVVAERIQAEMTERRAALGAPFDRMLGVSIGVADLDCAAEPTPASLFEAADRALYSAKVGGRNRVEQKPAALRSGVIRLEQAKPGRRRTGRITA